MEWTLSPKLACATTDQDEIGKLNMKYEHEVAAKKAGHEKRKGTKLSAEAHAKMSKAKKGRKHSAEHRANMRKAMKGKKTSTN